MRAYAIAFFLATGCFASGPVPSPPTKATVVLAAPTPVSGHSCDGAVYIGAVAIGPQAGYAITIPYTPQNCGGGLPPATAEPVLQFEKDGSDPHGTMIGTAGTSGTTTTSPTPRLAATASGAVWASSTTSSNDILVEPGDLHTMPGGAGGFMGPAGLIADGTNIYVAGWNPGGGRDDFDNPSYPCCGPANSGGGQDTFSRLPGPAQLAYTPSFECEASPDCLAANAQTLFFLDRKASGNTVQIGAFPKSGTQAADAAVLATAELGGPDAVPVGLAADDRYVAWAVSSDFGENPDAKPACAIYAYDLVAGTAAQVLTTTKFSCGGVAIEGNAIYVAIVGPEPQDSNCGGCTPSMHGFGIGRFTIGAGFESIAFGMPGYAAGPRRVYLDGTDLYAVDPFEIGKLSTSVLDGAQDFTP